MRRRAGALAASALLALALAGCTAGTTDPEPCAAGAVVAGDTLEDLQQAIDDAQPGEVIQLADTTYHGSLTVTASGTAEYPITLCGSRAATIDAATSTGGYALHLDGASFWTLDGFTVVGGQKGIVLDGSSSNELRDLDVSQTGQEGVHLRAGSSHNTISGTVVHDTGRTTPEFGEGIYIGSAQSNWCAYAACAPDASDDNAIVDTTVSATTAEAIDVKEGTTGGRITGSTLSIADDAVVDSVVDLKGDGWTFAENTVTAATAVGVQVHVIVTGWGAHNSISGNTLDVAAGVLAIELVGDARGAGNSVGCDNLTPAGTAVTSNTTCAT